VKKDIDDTEITLHRPSSARRAQSADENADRLMSKPKALSKRDVEIARYKERIRAIERSGTIASWNEYISFVISKILGIVGLFGGGLALLDPSLLPFSIPKPGVVAGVGLALLTGKSVLSLIAKMEKSLGGPR
jgi:hypothetical protein